MAVNMGTAIAYLELDTSKFSKGFVSACNDLKVFGDKSATAGQKLNGLSSAFKTAGGLLLKSVTLPLVGVGAAAVKTATDFEAGMSEVKAISGATGSEFEALKDKAIEMGAKTKFSASDSADAFKYMAMAGWDASQMMDGIAGIMDLAAASGEDLATTSDIVTDALTAFGLQANDSAHFADVLAQASSKSNTNVGLMGETFKYVAPVAGALGYSVEDCAVAIGMMANSGIKGSQAGTALRSTFTRLAKPTDTVEAAMEKYNISLTDAQGNMKPLSKLMLDLRDRFSGLSEAEKANLAATLSGQEGMSGLLAIVNASDEDFQKLTDEINNANGAAQDMADIMMDNTKGAIEQLKGALESAGILIGERLTPYIRQLAEWITGLVEKFNSLTEEQQDLIVRIGLVVAAIGPVLLIGSKVLGLFASLFNAIKNVKDVLMIFKGVITGISAPVYIAILVIGLLIGAFKTLWDSNEQFRNAIKTTWEDIKQSFVDFGNKFTETINSLGFEFEDITDLMSSLWKGFCKAIVPLFVEGFQTIANFIDNILNVILDLTSAVVSAIQGDWDGFKNYISEATMGLIKTVSDLFGDLLETILDIVANIVKAFGFEEASENIRNFADKAKEIIQSIPDAINILIDKIDEFTNNVSIFVDNVVQFFVDMWQGIVDGAESVIEFFTVTIPETFNNFVNVTIPNFINSVISWFENLPYNMGIIVGEILGYIYLWGTDLKNWVSTEVPKIIDSIISFFMELPGKIWEWLLKTIDNVISWGLQMLQKAKETGSNFVSNVIQFISQLPNKIKTYLSNVISNVASWATNMKNKAKQTAVDFVNNFINFMKDLPNKALSILNEVVTKVLSIGGQLYSAGRSIFNQLFDGIKSVGNSIVSWVKGFAENIGSFISGIISGFTSVVSSANSAKSAAQSVNGKHANGLDYVPYNGYVAELHEGERVLTKQQNKEYNEGKAGQGGDTFNFYNTKPTPYEYARQMKKAKRDLALGY